MEGNKTEIAIKHIKMLVDFGCYGWSSEFSEVISLKSLQVAVQAAVLDSAIQSFKAKPGSQQGCESHLWSEMPSTILKVEANLQISGHF